MARPTPLLLALPFLLSPPTTTPGTLRVHGLELVDATGAVVGSLSVREHGVELVLGGGSQASLVTDAAGAHLNLVGPGAVARAHASDRATLGLDGGPEAAPIRFSSEAVHDHDVRPPEMTHRAPHGDLSTAGLEPPR